MTRRGGWRRLLLVVGAGGTAVAVTAASGLEPRVVDLVLLVGLAVVGLGLLGDGIQDDALVWLPPPTQPWLAHGRDALTLSHARQIERHLSTHQPDADLRDRLAALADRALRARHGVVLASPEGERLLGADVSRVLTGPVHRLSLRTIDQCLRTIEEL